MVAISSPPLLALVALADEADGARVSEWLETRGYDVSTCGSVADVRQCVDAMQRVDVVITDAQLPDGDAHEVLVLAGMLMPFPYCAVVVSSTTTSEDAFMLAQAGTRALLERPLDSAMLERALPRDSLVPPPLDRVVRAYIGQVDLAELQRLVCAAALHQALALGGTRSGAARLLKVTRQAVQQMMRSEADGDVEDSAESPDSTPAEPAGGRRRAVSATPKA